MVTACREASTMRGTNGEFYPPPSLQPYTVKKSFSIFPSPAGMSHTKLSMGGKYDVIYKLFLLRESLVSDIPAGDGNNDKLFYGDLRGHILSVPTL